MMPALIISDDMINHDASSFTGQICSDNFASPFAAGVIVERVIVSEVLLHVSESDLRALVDACCRHWLLHVELKMNKVYLTCSMMLMQRLECMRLVSHRLIGHPFCLA